MYMPQLYRRNEMVATHLLGRTGIRQVSLGTGSTSSSELVVSLTLFLHGAMLYLLNFYVAHVCY